MVVAEVSVVGILVVLGIVIEVSFVKPSEGICPAQHLTRLTWTRHSARLICLSIYRSERRRWQFDRSKRSASSVFVMRPLLASLVNVFFGSGSGSVVVVVVVIVVATTSLR